MKPGGQPKLSQGPASALLVPRGFVVPPALSFSVTYFSPCPSPTAGLNPMHPRARAHPSLQRICLGAAMAACDTGFEIRSALVEKTEQVHGPLRNCRLPPHTRI